MGLINTGSAAIDRASYLSTMNTTVILKDNPINLGVFGTIDTIEIWSNTNLTGCKVALFDKLTSTIFGTRFTHSVGNITAGSKQTHAVNWVLKDSFISKGYIGIVSTGGTVKKDDTGYGGYWTFAGDGIPCTTPAFADTSSTGTISLRATGTSRDGILFFGMNF